MEQILVTIHDLAKLFKKDERTLYRYINKKGMPAAVIKKDKIDYFDFAECSKWRLDYLEKEIEEKEKQHEINEQKRRIIRLKAHRIEREIEEKEKTFHSAESCELVKNKIKDAYIYGLDGVVESLSNKLNPGQCKAEIFHILRNEVYNCKKRAHDYLMKDLDKLT